MLTRRRFVGTLAGVTAALAYGARVAPVGAAATGVDPGAVATLDEHRAPTQWGMSLPGIVSSFAPAGRQLALTLDACDRACDDGLLSTLQRNRVPAVLFVSSKWHQLGLTPIGFTVNADNGATSPASRVAAAVTGAAPGSIVLAHVNHPEAGTGAGLATAIPALQGAGWEFVPLAGRTLV